MIKQRIWYAILGAFLFTAGTVNFEKLLPSSAERSIATASEIQPVQDPPENLPPTENARATEEVVDPDLVRASGTTNNGPGSATEANPPSEVVTGSPVDNAPAEATPTVNNAQPTETVNTDEDEEPREETLARLERQNSELQAMLCRNEQESERFRNSVVMQINSLNSAFMFMFMMQMYTPRIMGGAGYFHTPPNAFMTGAQRSPVDDFILGTPWFNPWVFQPQGALFAPQTSETQATPTIDNSSRQVL